MSGRGLEGPGATALNEAAIRIDFYVLDVPGREARLRFACRLAEKAFGLQHRVHALTGDPTTASELDELLWTFRAGSFVPHVIDPTASDADNPITIGHGEAAQSGDLLINLTDEVPVCFDRFRRVAEIVDASEEGRQSGRSRFSVYRDSGYEPATHRIG